MNSAKLPIIFILLTGAAPGIDLPRCINILEIVMERLMEQLAQLLRLDQLDCNRDLAVV